MPNISDLDQSQLSAGPSEGTAAATANDANSGNIASLDVSQVQSPEEHIQEQYGTPGQTALAALEGAAQGVAGPLATGAELATGVTTPQAMRGRAAASPWAHGLGEAAGFAGSTAIPGVGEESLASHLASLGEHVEAALPALTPRLAVTGIKTGAEMAALGASDEISKMLQQDPNQSLQTAAVNVGLSGILGGAGGAVIGTVSPLWNKAVNKIPVIKTMSDMLGELRFWDTIDAEDPAQGMANEVNDRIQSADALMRGGLKGDLIDRLVQNVTPAQTAEHVDEIQKLLNSADPALQGKSVFQRAMENWRSKVTPQVDPISLQPVFEPQAADVFRATENLKRQMQEIAEPVYKRLPIDIEDRPAVYGAANLAAPLRESLENTKIWGAAGDAQAQYNKAISPLLQGATNEFLKEVAGKEFGERVADPNKLQTLLNKAQKGTAGLKVNHVSNYLDQVQEVADIINSQYLNNGLEAPAESLLNPTPILNHVLETPLSTGVKLAQWMKKNGAASLANMTGHAGGELVGGGLGFLVGHPMIGAWAGDKLLKPIISGLAKPFAETAVSSEGVKSAIDYAARIIQGQKALTDAVSNFYKPAGVIIAQHHIPDSGSREKLKASLDYASSTDNLTQAGGNIGHYMQPHKTAATALAATASNYFQNLKPKQPQARPLDPETPKSPIEEHAYNQALDVAQQPIMVLQHAKNGTLLPVHVQTLNTLYPALHDQIASKLAQGMIEAKQNGQKISYELRQGLSMILGYPVDSTMSPSSIQAIVLANGGAQSQVQQSAQKQQRKPATNKAISQINKVNALYATPTQTRQMEKRDIS